MTGFVQNVVTFTVVCFFFICEAIIHYSIGLNGSRKFFLELPPRNEMLHIVLTVAIFAGLSTLVTEIIGHVFSDK